MNTGRGAIAGCVLAGGQGRRLGGVDKGLLELGGRPLVIHVLDRFAPQVGRIMVSANRHKAVYRRYCADVVADHPGHAGPLAGIAAAMAIADAPLLAIAPCDSPFLPLALVDTLAQAVAAAGAEIGVARAGGRLQPVFALIDTSLRASLLTALAAGERKLEVWYERQRMVAVDFGDDNDAFLNINTVRDLRRAEAWLRRR